MKSKTFKYISYLLLFFIVGCGTTSTSVPIYQPFPRTTTYQPQTPPQMPVYRNIVHEVGPSETLWRISKMYDVDMNTIMAMNGIANPNKLENGQKLIIPNTKGPVPVINLYPNSRWTHIIIHHTATEAGNARSIDQMHHNRGFWNGLGYHFLIDNGTDGKMMGQIETAPRWIKQMKGAHTKASNMNERAIGISLVGNFSESHVPPKMMDSLVLLVKTLQDYYKIPNQNILGHGHVHGAKTECPGDYFPWAEFKRRL